MNRYTTYGLIAIFLWSTSVALSRSISEQLGAFTTATTVCFSSGILCFIMALFKGNPIKKIKKLSWKYLLICGIFFVLYFVSFFPAIELANDRKQVLEVALINYLWPIFTILFSLIFLKKKSNWLLIPAIALAIVGVFLVITQNEQISLDGIINNLSNNPIAYALGLLAAISWGLYSVMTRYLSTNNEGGGVYLFFLVSALLLFIIRLFIPEESNWNLGVIGEIFALSLTVAISYNCWDASMRKGNVVFLASCSYLIPFLSTLITSIYLHITAGISLWIGCALIIIGAYLSCKAISDKVQERGS